MQTPKQPGASPSILPGVCTDLSANSQATGSVAIHPARSLHGPIGKLPSNRERRRSRLPSSRPNKHRNARSCLACRVRILLSPKLAHAMLKRPLESRFSGVSIAHVGPTT